MAVTKQCHRNVNASKEKLITHHFETRGHTAPQRATRGSTGIGREAEPAVRGKAWPAGALPGLSVVVRAGRCRGAAGDRLVGMGTVGSGMQEWSLAIGTWP